MISRHLPGRLRFGITPNRLIWRVGSRASSSVERHWIRRRHSSVALSVFAAEDARDPNAEAGADAPQKEAGER